MSDVSVLTVCTLYSQSTYLSAPSTDGPGGVVSGAEISALDRWLTEQQGLAQTVTEREGIKRKLDDLHRAKAASKKVSDGGWSPDKHCDTNIDPFKWPRQNLGFKHIMWKVSF